MGRKEDGPDQARSWAIAMAGGTINSLLSGVSRTTGLFYVALIETYGVSRMQANLPFTLRNVVRNLVGPVAGVIGQKYGGRDVTFVGGIFASLGILLCCFAPNVVWITALWGGMHGIGVALGNTLFPVIINQYFLKYRATASGLSLSGACIGSFVFPVVIEYMLTHIGLSGTFLITGGFIMHVLPAAILMTEPSWIKKEQPVKPYISYSEKYPKVRSISQMVQKLEKIGEDTEVVAAVTVKKKTSVGGISNSMQKTEDGVQPVTRSARVFSRNGVDNPSFVGSKTDLSEKNCETVEAESPPEVRCRTISIGDTSLTVYGPPNPEVQEKSVKRGLMMMLRDPMFHLISFTLAGFALLFDPTITVIVDYIMDKGFKEDDAKYFISMMSLGDLLGRLCFGWVTDRNYMTPPRFMLLLQVVQGLCFLSMPFIGGLYTLMTIIIVYGLASGANLVMFPILISKYLPSVQSLAIGFVSIFTGFVSFAVPVLIGYFRDKAGSYDGMFMITGSISVVSGCLWLFEPLCVRLQQYQKSTVIISS